MPTRLSLKCWLEPGTRAASVVALHRVGDPHVFPRLSGAASDWLAPEPGLRRGAGEGGF